MWEYFIFVLIIKIKIKWEKRRKEKEKKDCIQRKENKKFLKFQFKGVMGGVRRIAGEFEFL